MKSSRIALIAASVALAAIAAWSIAPALAGSHGDGEAKGKTCSAAKAHAEEASAKPCPKAGKAHAHEASGKDCPMASKECAKDKTCAKAKGGCGGVCGGKAHHAKAEGKSMPAKLAAEATSAIEAARKAVKAGDHKAALAHLDKAETVLAKLRKHAPGHHGARDVASAEKGRETKPFANARCPMMGARINPKKVPANLTRQYKGQKVAFCCGGCPAAWDKLSDEQKEAKLDKVRADDGDKQAMAK